MTARIIPAAEARALLEAATPGPWSRLPLTVDLIGPVPLVCLRPLRDGDSDLLVAAPDLAASVVALHGEVERLRAILPPERERGQGIVGDGSWAVFAERVVAERDALDEELSWMIDALIGPQDDLGTDEALRLAREEIGRLKALAPRPAPPLIATEKA